MKKEFLAKVKHKKETVRGCGKVPQEDYRQTVCAGITAVEVWFVLVESEVDLKLFE